MQTQLFDDNALLYSSILDDISRAQEYVYIETYRITPDAIAQEMVERLIERLRAGVEVKILVDAFGGALFETLSKRIIQEGGEVRFFKKIKLFFVKTFLRNNSRNHRKLVVIDDRIVYFGSSNITAYSIPWRELNLRVEDPVAEVFKPIFLRSYALHKFYDINPFERIPVIITTPFRIIQDTPSSYFQSIRNHFLYLIRSAKEEIRIETPYFLPGHSIRKALSNAAKRGVRVKIYTPFYSDLRTVDLLRNRYLGTLHKSGVKFLFYSPNNLHAKCFLVDNKRFSIGSANIDYRSFRYQFEIMVSGTEESISPLLKKHLDETESLCVPFNYGLWKTRGNVDRLIEWMITPFRRLF